MATNAVLDFILSLLRDDEAAAAYCVNPDAALAAAGLGDVSHADIVAVAPLVAESGLFAGAGSQLSAILGAGGAGGIGGGLAGGAAIGGGLSTGLGLAAGAIVGGGLAGSGIIGGGIGGGFGGDLDLAGDIAAQIGAALS
ncbi:MAG: IniB N-terminal domain-containing protein, partial [Rhodococcus sp. (in: high G+C Gram-positive bacteria)]